MGLRPTVTQLRCVASPSSESGKGTSRSRLGDVAPPASCGSECGLEWARSAASGISLGGAAYRRSRMRLTISERSSVSHRRGASIRLAARSALRDTVEVTDSYEVSGDSEHEVGGW